VSACVEAYSSLAVNEGKSAEDILPFMKQFYMIIRKVYDGNTMEQCMEKCKARNVSSSIVTSQTGVVRPGKPDVALTYHGIETPKPKAKPKMKKGEEKQEKTNLTTAATMTTTSTTSITTTAAMTTAMTTAETKTKIKTKSAASKKIKKLETAPPRDNAPGLFSLEAGEFRQIPQRSKSNDAAPPSKRQIPSETYGTLMVKKVEKWRWNTESSRIEFNALFEGKAATQWEYGPTAWKNAEFVKNRGGSILAEFVTCEMPSETQSTWPQKQKEAINGLRVWAHEFMDMGKGKPIKTAAAPSQSTPPAKKKKGITITLVRSPQKFPAKRSVSFAIEPEKSDQPKKKTKKPKKIGGKKEEEGTKESPAAEAPTPPAAPSVSPHIGGIVVILTQKLASGEISPNEYKTAIGALSLN
jgi:hypothetical protein